MQSRSALPDSRLLLSGRDSIWCTGRVLVQFRPSRPARCNRDLTPCPVVPQLGGIAEPVVILATLALLIVTPAGTAAFWLVAGALAALVTVQVIFWTKTQPASLPARQPASSRPAGEALHATGRLRAISGSARNIARAGRNSGPVPTDSRGRAVEARREPRRYLSR
jgi:hypothetical protein